VSKKHGDLRPVGRVSIPAADSPPRLGVIGGTFDPPHYGHLVLAENGCVQLGLERVLFVLAGQPPHKPNRPITPVHHRLAMVEAAIAGEPAFALSRVDLDRPGPHYTVETLALLRREYPEAELFFLMGGDSLADFPGWYDSAGIVRQARLAVMQRPGYEPDLAKLERAVPGIRERGPCQGSESGWSGSTHRTWTLRPPTCGGAPARDCRCAICCRRRSRLTSASTVYTR